MNIKYNVIILLFYTFIYNFSLSLGLVKEQIVVTKKKADFRSAVKICAELGLNIIRIENDEDNDLVHKLSNGTMYWIDGLNFNMEGTWFNIDMEKLTYWKWYKGEPNNWGNNQNCIQVNYFRTNEWDDENCQGKNQVICYSKKELLFDEIFVTDVLGSFGYAQSYCRSIGLELIRIENDYENDRVFKSANFNNIGPFWIDGNNVNSENQWVNSKNKILNYTKWEIGEIIKTKKEKCILGKFLETNEWFPGDCYKRNGIICSVQEKMLLIDIIITGKNNTFDFARKYCQEKGLRLIRIQNEFENNLVYQSAINKSIGKYWLDGKNREDEWYNSDNKALEYKNWHFLEPDNDKNEKNCIETNSFGKKEWVAANCSLLNAIICLNRKDRF